LRVSQWLKNNQFWLLPGVCVVCDKPSHRHSDLCAACQAKLIQIARPCLTCALPLPPGDYASSLCGLCLARRQRMTRAVAGFAYAEPVSSLVAAFKYRAALQQGRVLGDLLAARLQQVYTRQDLPEVLVPVPLHPVRLRERGFNQALVLARQLGQALNIPVMPEALVRIRHTPAQQGLSAKQRKRNLRGAFGLHGDLAAYRSIALVDDVVTTMSTMHELARILRRQHPDLALHVWCLARA
jgi:ComF family protein